MTGESLGDRARPHTHTHKEPTVPSKFNTHSRDGFSTALVASAREAAEICECGHPLSEHAESGWGPNTVCVEVLDDPNAGWHGVCPCVRHLFVDDQGLGGWKGDR